MKDFAVGHRLTREYLQAFNRKDSIVKKLQEALQALLFDVQAKMSKKRKLTAQEEAGRGITPTSTVRS